MLSLLKVSNTFMSPKGNMDKELSELKLQVEKFVSILLKSAFIW